MLYLKNAIIISMNRYLTNEEFFSIYGKVPRLNVDLIIESDGGILMALRTIEPHIGFWHFPGGTVYKSETLHEAARRVAKKETGLDVTFGECLGYIEFPDEMRSGISIHTVSIVLKAVSHSGTLKHDEHAKELKWHTKLPEKTYPGHDTFLKQKGLLL